MPGNHRRPGNTEAGNLSIEAKEGRLEKERKDSFHVERHADDAACLPRELRPVRAELKLHRNPGDDTKKKVDGEEPSPKTSRCVV